MQTNGKRACFLFQTSYGRFFYVFQIFVSVIHLSNKKTGVVFHLFVDWWMINTVKKSAFQWYCIQGSIERGVTNLPLWQHFGWMVARRHPWACAAQRGRTYATRGRDVVRLETLFNSHPGSCVNHATTTTTTPTTTTTTTQVKRAGVFCGLCAPVVASIIVIVIDFLGFSVR